MSLQRASRNNCLGSRAGRVFNATQTRINIFLLKGPLGPVPWATVPLYHGTMVHGTVVPWQQISRGETQEISCIATQEISRAATQDISCVATQDISCVAAREIL